MLTQSAAGGSSSSSSTLTPSLSPLPNVHRHSSHVWTILGQNPSPMTLQGTNTYILGTGKHRILIDTAEGKKEYTTLLKELIESESIQRLTILLTHWHRDHTGGIQAVCQLFDDAHQPEIYKFDGARNLPKSIIRQFPALAHRIRSMSDGATFTVEGATVTALHTPGHTDDHCCFTLAEESDSIFTGDTILGASSAVFQDLHSYMHSLRRIGRMQPRRIYPAHGPIIEGANAPQYVEQYLHHREKREEQIVQAMREMKKRNASVNLKEEGDINYPNAAALVKEIYIDLAPNLLVAAANNVLLHLGKLEKEGRVRAIQPTPPRVHQQEDETCSHTEDGDEGEVDDCKAEVAKAHAIAMERAEWRWKLTEQ